MTPTRSARSDDGEFRTAVMIPPITDVVNKVVVVRIVKGKVAVSVVEVVVVVVEVAGPA